MRDLATRIFLVRHADVENPNRVLYGHLPGFELSALGRAQAAALGEKLSAENVRLIVHSPLSRAAETASIINRGLQHPVPMDVDSELREADFSRYLQGVPFWQIPIRRPLWLVHKARRGILPGDEAIEDLGGRVLKVVRRIAREHPDETIVIVSHADPIQAAWLLFDGRPQTEREMYRKSVQRAAMLELDVDADRVVSIRYLPAPKLPS